MQWGGRRATPRLFLDSPERSSFHHSSLHFSSLQRPTLFLSSRVILKMQRDSQGPNLLLKSLSIQLKDLVAHLPMPERFLVSRYLSDTAHASLDVLLIITLAPYSHRASPSFATSSFNCRTATCKQDSTHVKAFDCLWTFPPSVN